MISCSRQCEQGLAWSCPMFLSSSVLVAEQRWARGSGLTLWVFSIPRQQSHTFFPHCPQVEAHPCLPLSTPWFNEFYNQLKGSPELVPLNPVVSWKFRNIIFQTSKSWKTFLECFQRMDFIGENSFPSYSLYTFHKRALGRLSRAMSPVCMSAAISYFKFILGVFYSKWYLLNLLIYTESMYLLFIYFYK